MLNALGQGRFFFTTKHCEEERERKKRVLTHGKEDRNNKRESERDETSL